MTPIEALKKIAENPYPINIFPPLTKSEWNYIKEALNVAEDEISLDRLSADIARTIRKNDIAIATEALASYKAGEDLEQEIERLKELIEDAYWDGRNFEMQNNESITWDIFKSKNNL